MLDEIEEGVGSGATAFHSPGDGEDRRRDARFSAIGAEVYLFLESGERYRLNLRDLGALGTSGPTAAPVSVGDVVVVQLEEMCMPDARVAWQSGGVIGLAFFQPLPVSRLERLRDRHQAGLPWSPAMRAGSDLHRWWTEKDAHVRGRRPRLNAGGHDHPLPR